MLPKSNRLPSSEIRSVMRRGKRFSTASMQMIVAASSVQAPRFAFVVSTSVDKRATRRNRIKRLMREEVRTLLSNLKDNTDVVLTARSGQEDKVTKSVEELLRRANLL